VEKIKLFVKKFWKVIVSVLALKFIWRIIKAYTSVRIVENKDLEKEIKKVKESVEAKKKEVEKVKVVDLSLEDEIKYWNNQKEKL
jgi:cell division septum initiation protein DivIVA